MWLGPLTLFLVLCLGQVKGHSVEFKLDVLTAKVDKLLSRKRDVCPSFAATCSSRVDWSMTDGTLVSLSTGPSGTWGVNANNQVWYRQGTYGSPASFGSDWTYVSGSLRQLDVGTDVVWGVTTEGNLTCRRGIQQNAVTGTSWRTFTTRAKHVAISPNGQLVSLSLDGKLQYRIGQSSECAVDGKWVSWATSSLSLKQISVGKAGVWAVDNSDNIFYRPGSYGDGGNTGLGWRQVPGGLSWLGVGEGFVIGVNREGEIWRREGVTEWSPGGNRWLKLTGGLQTVDAFDGCYAWGTNSNQQIWLGRFE